MMTTAIAYLGPAGTNCDEAARAFATRLAIADPTFVECATFDEVFDEVERGKCTYGVVGKENSLEGPVTATLDNFATRSAVTILAEEVMDIHHCLMAQKGVDLASIKTVASHSQGIAQCRRYLNERLPGRTLTPTSSTAESARLAATDPTIAAIANDFAAELYDVSILEENIEDHFGNQTSFALIGRLGLKVNLPADYYKTTLAIFLQMDRAGELNMILSELLYAGINLTMIQSRPTKQSFGDYMFFLEFQGTADRLEVQTALACLRMKLREVKVIGSYPVLGSLSDR